METIESQIAQWRAHAAGAPAVRGRDVDELEAHLRGEIAGLGAAGLSPQEAFLVALKRVGESDAPSREYASENRGRLWKQLVASGGAAGVEATQGWLEALFFALAAGAAAQAVRIAAGVPEELPRWPFRNAGLLALIFLAGYFARRRGLDRRRVAIAAAPFALAAVLVNLYPYGEGSATEMLVALHLPLALWFAAGYVFMGGSSGPGERRMAFVRFTGEWVIYFALIALGGGVLLGLTALILEPVGPGLAERAIEWILPSGAAGALIVAAWLVESRQRVAGNIAPVLTMIFTPLFAVMLTVAAGAYAVSGGPGAFNRDLLLVFDALLVVVLGLVVYAMSARDPTRPPGWMDRVQLVAVAGAIALDAMVLAALAARIGDLGLTPNRVAVLGLNLLLLVNLSGTGWLSVRFLQGRGDFERLERWQTSYLPAFAIWAAAVVVALPPLFGFR